MKCPKCGSEMGKSGNMSSGNTKYDLYKCKKCGNEKMVAVKLM
jgi:hypothetical protein